MARRLAQTRMANRSARKAKRDPVHGWLVVDKELGATSTQVVARARRLYNAAKAGHAGTLDPLATGLLPVAFGEATKTIPFVMDGHKRYRFTAQWGEFRDTDDGEGQVIGTSDQRPSGDQIQHILPRFTGNIMQVPPAFSAIKVDGRRAYDLARQDQKPDLQAREIRVDSLNLVDQPDADHAIFEMTCGKGSYVRALVRDMAKALGTAGYVSALCRTEVGPFSLDQAISLAELEALNDSAALEACLMPIEVGLAVLNALPVNPDQASRLRHGQAVPLVRAAVDNQGNRIRGPATLYATLYGQAVALVTMKDGALQPARVFNY